MVRFESEVESPVAVQVGVDLQDQVKVNRVSLYSRAVLSLM